MNGSRRKMFERNSGLFYWFLIFIILFNPILSEKVLASQNPTVDWILKKVDENITSENKIITAKMIIHLRRTSRTMEFKSFIQGTEKAFTEFLSPPREKGTKMLKLEDSSGCILPGQKGQFLFQVIC